MKALKWIAGIIGGILVLIIIIVIIGVATSNDTEEQGQPTQTTPQQITPEQTITSIVQDTMGTCNREGLKKVSGIDIVNAGYGYNVDIHYAIDDNLSEDWIIEGARIETLDTMNALYTSGLDIQWVDMYGSFSMVDKYGNAKETEVMHTRLGRDTASKIAWENITSDMLFEVLDFKDIHPAFNE